MTNPSEAVELRQVWLGQWLKGLMRGFKPRADHPPPQAEGAWVDELAQEIRRVDGNHDLGAGALAEALMPFLSAHPAPQQGVEAVRDDIVLVREGVAEDWGQGQNYAAIAAFERILAALRPSPDFMKDPE